MTVKQTSRVRSRSQTLPNPLLVKVKLVCVAVLLIVCITVVAVIMHDVNSTSASYLDGLEMKSANQVIDSKLKFKIEWDSSQILAVEEGIKAAGGSYSGANGVVDATRGLSGVMFGDHPAELFMVCMMSESGGGVDGSVTGDSGKAYGMMQLDYRYHVVPFMQYAYSKNPTLWAGFASYTTYASGDARLMNNSEIIATFESARATDPVSYVSDQANYFYNNFVFATYTAMNNAGYDLDTRHIAVSAAMLSSDVNCGTQYNKYIANMSPEMSDEEMINMVYHLRRTGVTKQDNKDGARWATTGENDLVLKLLSGHYTIYSDITEYNSFCQGWYWSKFTTMYGTEW